MEATGWVFVLNATITLVIGSVLAIGSLRMRLAGKAALGTITDVDRDSGEFPIVTFVPTSGAPPVTFRSSVSSGTVDVGESVPVLYREEAPQKAIVATTAQMWGPAIACGALTVVFAAVAVVLLLLA